MRKAGSLAAESVGHHPGMFAIPLTGRFPSETPKAENPHILALIYGLDDAREIGERGALPVLCAFLVLCVLMVRTLLIGAGGLRSDAFKPAAFPE